MAMNFLALVLLATAGQPADGQASAPPPAERSRPGLWIGDMAFAPADIAGAAQDYDGDTGVPIVLVSFTESGQAKFGQAQQGRLYQPLEISIDGEVVSSPILTEIISGNRVTISGQFTVEEAAALARRIMPPRRR